MRVLVTGGNGFLGRAICARLVEHGHEVGSVSRRPAPELEELGVHDLRCDLGDADRVRGLLQGWEAVVHTAARVGIFGPREEFFRVNLEGTRNLLEESLRAGVGRFVHTSTPSVCFDGQGHVNADEKTPYAKRFLAAYPESKALAERLVRTANSKALSTCVLRPHLIFGPGDPHLVPRLIARGQARRLVQVGEGTNRVSLCWIDNAAGAHVDALERLEPGARHAGSAYFVAQEDPVVLWEWIGELFERLDVPPVRRRISRRLAYGLGGALETLWNLTGRTSEPPMTRFLALQLASDHSYDMAPAKRDFGYRERVSMSAATERLIELWQGTQVPTQATIGTG